jgi:hypothetical protein
MPEPDNVFYVYHWLRRDGTPYYVGKGKGDRAYDKTRTACNAPTDPARIVLIAENLTEEDAFWLEIEEIAKYGRRCDGGSLFNLTFGGEGTSGYKHKSDTKLILAEQKKGENNPNWGGLKPGHADKISATMKGTRTGENNPMHGRSHKESTKEKMAARARLRKRGWVTEPNGKLHLIDPTTFVLPEGWIRGMKRYDVNETATLEMLL